MVALHQEENIRKMSQGKDRCIGNSYDNGSNSATSYNKMQNAPTMERENL